MPWVYKKCLRNCPSSKIVLTLTGNLQGEGYKFLATAYWSAPPVHSKHIKGEFHAAILTYLTNLFIIMRQLEIHHHRREKKLAWFFPLPLTQTFKFHSADTQC